MNYAIRALLTELIDYAGLFPPAALDMATAVRNYAAYRRSEHQWMLARFIVPVARLDEFETAAAELLPRENSWQLSALLGNDWQSDLASIAAFNQRHAGRAMIGTVETKAESVEQIETLQQALPTGLTAYFEISFKDDPAELIATLAQIGGLAKARTGGVTAEAFPSALELARFIAACAKAEVPFKATAGLHHPLRGEYRLTYAPDSPTATMHGFLNVFLAAAFAQSGMDVAQLVEVLEERSPTAFQFESGRVVWRGEELVRAHLINARHLAALAFGSCSFTEPIEDLQKLGLL